MKSFRVISFYLHTTHWNFCNKLYAFITKDIFLKLECLMLFTAQVQVGYIFKVKTIKQNNKYKQHRKLQLRTNTFLHFVTNHSFDLRSRDWQRSLSQQSQHISIHTCIFSKYQTVNVPELPSCLNNIVGINMFVKQETVCN